MDSFTSAQLNDRRRRTPLACTNCRQRKVKCKAGGGENLSRVSCDRCLSKGLVCEFHAVSEGGSDSSTTTPETLTAPLPPGHGLHSNARMPHYAATHQHQYAGQYAEFTTYPDATWQSQPQAQYQNPSGGLPPAAFSLPQAGYYPPSQWVQQQQPR
ncbi:unnamed protein product, partial [Mycena citricolor]